jgi:glycosyltransferase involved in cell wall biosynthesis
METTRVGFLVSGASLGGAERQLLRFLAKCDRRQIVPVVLTVLAANSPLAHCHSDYASELRNIDVLHVAIGAERFSDAVALARTLRSLQRMNLDVIQTIGLRVDLLVRPFRRALGIRRLVSSIRGLERQRPAWAFALDGLTSPLVDLYISNTEAGRDEFVKRARIRPEKIAVVPNGIDADYVVLSTDMRTRGQARRALRATEDEAVVTCVANMTPTKGIEDLVWATRGLRDRGFTIRLVLCGEDRTNGGLLALTERVGISRHVQFLGHRQDVASILMATDVFVLPSHWEGMPNAIMEAMAFGLPIVATRVGGIPELLDDGRCGVIVEPRSPDRLTEAIEALLLDSDAACDVGRRAWERVRRQYSVERMVASTTTALVGGLS